MKLHTTPSQVEGPFYPVSYKANENNDLTLGKSGHVAAGHIIYVLGQVMDTSASPLQNVLVEIWQADNNGRYDHPNDMNHPAPLDPNFHYWARTVSDSKGNYLFKTIKPTAYNDQGDWRTPHIHFKVYLKRGTCQLTTQMYFEGETLNSQDTHLNSLTADEQTLLLTHPTTKNKTSNLEKGIDTYEFNLVLPK